MNKNSKIFIAGHRGMVGSQLVTKLKEEGYNNLIYRTREELDLRDNHAVKIFFENENIEYIFLLAAKVGGIHANINYPAEFLFDNLMIEANVIHNSYLYKIKKLLFLSSSCVYPRETSQPMSEEQILTGLFEPTNEAYAIAKVAGMKLCEYYNKQYNSNFIVVIPPNLYGINDNFNPENSHVLSALINKIHLAKVNDDEVITLWGTGNARREFLYIDDLVEGLMYMMNNYDKSEFINMGSGVDISIHELATLISRIIGFPGSFQYDTSKPDGMPQKLMNIEKIINFGWQPKTSLEEGIKNTYKWYLRNIV